MKPQAVSDLVLARRDEIVMLVKFGNAYTVAEVALETGMPQRMVQEYMHALCKDGQMHISGREISPNHYRSTTCNLFAIGPLPKDLPMVKVRVRKSKIEKTYRQMQLNGEQLVISRKAAETQGFARCEFETLFYGSKA